MRGSGEAAGRSPRGPLTQTRPTLYPLQEHQGPGLANGGSPKDSPAHEVTGGGGGAYTRFDVPRPRTRRSWPSFRGGAGRVPASRVSSARGGQGVSGGLGPLRCAAS